MTESDGREILNRKMETYLEERKRFVVGFVRFVLERGLKTQAPPTQGKKVETWWDVGRRLYGRELFDSTLDIEVQARRQAKAAKAG